MIKVRQLTIGILAVVLLGSVGFGQTVASKARLGSETAKGGFKNETEIREKFNRWKTDPDAQAWLATMGYRVGDIESVNAVKPSGEKSDVEVTVRTRSGQKTEGISIKLVSGTNGFNQIDKRWLSHYAKMWQMPLWVENALKRFTGEVPPTRPGRAANRMFLDELDKSEREAVIAFFVNNKDAIVSDLFQGDGPHAAAWMMVAFKATANTRWALRPVKEVIAFYGDGPVVITRNGNLKLGRITMQRKGGDGGRETAKMLQFKIDPSELLTRP